MSLDSDATDARRDSHADVEAKATRSGEPVADDSVSDPSGDAQAPCPVESGSPDSPDNISSLGLSTQSVHAGEKRQKSEGSITGPIFTASTFTFESTDALLRFVEGHEQREEYGRYGTPNERSVEAKLAALEGYEEAIVYSSGMAAIVGLLMSRLNAGDEIVFFDQCYHRSREFCSKHLSRFGVVTRQVPTGDYDAMEAAITAKTKMLVSESPTNPHLSVVDLEKIRGDRKGVRSRNVDRRYAGDSLQPAPDRLRRRPGVALGHQVPRRSQRSSGRRYLRKPRSLGIGAFPCAGFWAA